MVRFSLSVIISSLFVLIGMISVNVLYGQLEEKDIFFDITQISDAISILSGGGGNVGFSVGDDGIFYFDEKHNDLTEKLQSAIRQISLQKP